MGITGINLKLLKQITQLLNKKKTFHYKSQVYLQDYYRTLKIQDQVSYETIIFRINNNKIPLPKTNPSANNTSYESTIQPNI